MIGVEEITLFGGQPFVSSIVRLIVSAVAVIHCLLSARVVLMRTYHHFTGYDSTINERVPTGAMLAYGILTGNIARQLLTRIPQSEPLVWTAVLIYGAALVAGSWGFAHIVYLRRSEQPGGSREDGDGLPRRR